MHHRFTGSHVDASFLPRLSFSFNFISTCSCNSSVFSSLFCSILNPSKHHHCKPLRTQTPPAQQLLGDATHQHHYKTICNSSSGQFHLLSQASTATPFITFNINEIQLQLHMFLRFQFTSKPPSSLLHQQLSNISTSKSQYYQILKTHLRLMYSVN